MCVIINFYINILVYGVYILSNVNVKEKVFSINWLVLILEEYKLIEKKFKGKLTVFINVLRVKILFFF